MKNLENFYRRRKAKCVLILVWQSKYKEMIWYWISCVCKSALSLQFCHEKTVGIGVEAIHSWDSNQSKKIFWHNWSQKYFSWVSLHQQSLESGKLKNFEKLLVDIWIKIMFPSRICMSLKNWPNLISLKRLLRRRRSSIKKWGLVETTNLRTAKMRK